MTDHQGLLARELSSKTEMEETLFLQLPKLLGAKSNEALEHVLQTLWNTRRTGLKPPDKAYIQTHLQLPTIEELDPVLACLRLLIRKCVHENLTGDELQKLFPLDVPLELQSILVLLLQKYQNMWKEDASRDQSPWQRPRVAYQVKVGNPPAPTTFSALDMLSPIWPRQDDVASRLNRGKLHVPTQPVADSNLHVPLHQDDGPTNNLAFLPRLKSMTWTLENQNSTQTSRVAIITLKLQDFTKSPSGETEVKFQLSRDTLDAMLRSMTYISEQLSSIAGLPSGPLQKKQRQ